MEVVVTSPQKTYEGETTSGVTKYVERAVQIFEALNSDDDAGTIKLKCIDLLIAGLGAIDFYAVTQDQLQEIQNTIANIVRQTDLTSNHIREIIAICSEDTIPDVSELRIHGVIERLKSIDWKHASDFKNTIDCLATKTCTVGDRLVTLYKQMNKYINLSFDITTLTVKDMNAHVAALHKSIDLTTKPYARPLYSLNLDGIKRTLDTMLTQIDAYTIPEMSPTITEDVDDQVTNAIAGTFTQLVSIFQELYETVPGSETDYITLLKQMISDVDVFKQDVSGQWKKTLLYLEKKSTKSVSPSVQGVIDTSNLETSKQMTVKPSPLPTLHLPTVTPYKLKPYASDLIRIDLKTSATGKSHVVIENIETISTSINNAQHTLDTASATLKLRQTDFSQHWYVINIVEYNNNMAQLHTWLSQLSAHGAQSVSPNQLDEIVEAQRSSLSKVVDGITYITSKVTAMTDNINKLQDVILRQVSDLSIGEGMTYVEKTMQTLYKWHDKVHNQWKYILNYVMKKKQDTEKENTSLVAEYDQNRQTIKQLENRIEVGIQQLQAQNVEIDKLQKQHDIDVLQNEACTIKIEKFNKILSSFIKICSSAHLVSDDVKQLNEVVKTIVALSSTVDTAAIATVDNLGNVHTILNTAMKSKTAFCETILADKLQMSVSQYKDQVDQCIDEYKRNCFNARVDPVNVAPVTSTDVLFENMIAIMKGYHVVCTTASGRNAEPTATDRAFAMTQDWKNAMSTLSQMCTYLEIQHTPIQHWTTHADYVSGGKACSATCQDLLTAVVACNPSTVRDLQTQHKQSLAMKETDAANYVATANACAITSEWLECLYYISSICDDMNIRHEDIIQWTTYELYVSVGRVVCDICRRLKEATSKCNPTTLSELNDRFKEITDTLTAQAKEIERTFTLEIDAVKSQHIESERTLKSVIAVLRDEIAEKDLKHKESETTLKGAMASLETKLKDKTATCSITDPWIEVLKCVEIMCRRMNVQHNALVPWTTQDEYQSMGRQLLATLRLLLTVMDNCNPATLDDLTKRYEECLAGVSATGDPHTKCTAKYKELLHKYNVVSATTQTMQTDADDREKQYRLLTTKYNSLVSQSAQSPASCCTISCVHSILVRDYLHALGYVKEKMSSALDAHTVAVTSAKKQLLDAINDYVLEAASPKRDRSTIDRLLGICDTCHSAIVHNECDWVSQCQQWQNTINMLIAAARERDACVTRICGDIYTIVDACYKAHNHAIDPICSKHIDAVETQAQTRQAVLSGVIELMIATPGDRDQHLQLLRRLCKAYDTHYPLDLANVQTIVNDRLKNMHAALLTFTDIKTSMERHLRNISKLLDSIADARDRMCDFGSVHRQECEMLVGSILEFSKSVNQLKVKGMSVEGIREKVENTFCAPDHDSMTDTMNNAKMICDIIDTNERDICILGTKLCNAMQFHNAACVPDTNILQLVCALPLYSAKDTEATDIQNTISNMITAGVPQLHALVQTMAPLDKEVVNTRHTLMNALTPWQDSCNLSGNIISQLEAHSHRLREERDQFLDDAMLQELNHACEDYAANMTTTTKDIAVSYIHRGTHVSTLDDIALNIASGMVLAQRTQSVVESPSAQTIIQQIRTGDTQVLLDPALQATLALYTCQQLQLDINELAKVVDDDVALQTYVASCSRVNPALDTLQSTLHDISKQTIQRHIDVVDQVPLMLNKYTQQLCIIYLSHPTDVLLIKLLRTCISIYHALSDDLSLCEPFTVIETNLAVSLSDDAFYGYIGIGTGVQPPTNDMYPSVSLGNMIAMFCKHLSIYNDIPSTFVFAQYALENILLQFKLTAPALNIVFPLMHMLDGIFQLMFVLPDVTYRIIPSQNVVYVYCAQEPLDMDDTVRHIESYMNCSLTAKHIKTNTDITLLPLYFTLKSTDVEYIVTTPINVQTVKCTLSDMLKQSRFQLMTTLFMDATFVRGKRLQCTLPIPTDLLHCHRVLKRARPIRSESSSASSSSVSSSSSSSPATPPHKKATGNIDDDIPSLI